MEDSSRQSFVIPLRGLAKQQIRDTLSNLADAAVEAQSANDLKQALSGRQPIGGISGPANHLLVALGRIAGIGGIAAGILLMVFRSILRQKIWPQLDPQHAYILLMAMVLLTFGLAIAGAVIWANQVNARRSTINLVIGFSCLVCGVFAYMIRPGPADLGYRLRVTVLNPNRVPVNQAHVWSTLGGEVKQVDGGWEIDLTAPAASAKRRVTIRAEVADLAWRGETEVELGSDRAPAAVLQLQSAGEANIRGTVVDENDDSVANAFVSVPGFETVTTDGHGTFSLPAHTEAGKDVQLHAEKSGYVSLTKSFPAGGTPVIVVLQRRPGRASASLPVRPVPAAPVLKTGDAVIDRVLANLAELKRLDRAPAESRIAEALAPLFNRPAFYGIREGDWRFFLYPLCRTRLILEQHLGDFKSNPDTRDKISKAIQIMVNLQNSVAGLYGPNFSVTQHLSRYVDNAKAFGDNLPPVIESPSQQFFDQRDAQIRQVRELMRGAGLPLQ